MALNHISKGTKNEKSFTFRCIIGIMFSGCGIGSIVELPFSVVRSVVDIADSTGAVSGTIKSTGSAFKIGLVISISYFLFLFG